MDCKLFKSCPIIHYRTVRWEETMKIKLFVLLIIVIFLVGCTNNIEENKLEEIISNFYTQVEHQDLESIKLNQELYLIGVRDDYNNGVNYSYSLYDLKNDTSVQIEGIYQLIEKIYLENDCILFFCDGRHQAHSFKEFPITYSYNIKTGDLVIVEEYKPIILGSESLLVGGNINASLIESVENDLNSIIIDFGIHETSFIAGGNFAPSIEIMSGDKNQLSFDFQNLYYNERQFNNLLESEIITKIEFESYINIDNTEHEIIRFWFNEKYGEYLCEFIDGEDGFKKLLIKLK